VNIHEAKTHFSRLVERAAAGEEIVISKAGKPMAKLVPYIVQGKPRKGGFLHGQIWEAPDCWEPDEELIATMTTDPLLPPGAPSARVAEEAKPHGRKR
jgi:prevent-host-death family protein